TYTADRTVKVMTFDINAASSLSAEVAPELRDALCRLQRELGHLQPLLAQVAQPIDPDAAALRHGNLLPGPSDSANSLNLAGSIAIKLRRTIFKDGRPDVWEAGYTGGGSATLALLGQSAGGGLDVEVMFAYADFVAMVDTAIRNARTGLPPRIVQGPV